VKLLLYRNWRILAVCLIAIFLSTLLSFTHNARCFP